MAKLNVKNRSLFIRDNVDILDNLNSATVDLIYLDPPFNSNRTYSAPIGSRAAGSSFKDAWTLNDIDLAWIGQINETHPALSAVIDAAGMAGGKGDKSYLVFMARRLLELRRILKDDGSVYLHCDPRMSHPLKLVMDCVFGKKNFRNEIVWGYKTGGVPRARGSFAQKHDVILFYAKNKNFFTQLKQKSYAPTLPDSHTASGKRLGVERDAINKFRNVIMRDWWVNTSIMPEDDIRELYRNDRERTGYPTQKPLSLLERIIKASSKEGDVVLDPFCGCATTMVAAERLNRQWVGIDISDKAKHLIVERLQAEKHLWKASRMVIPRTDIPARTDNGELTVKPKAYKHILYGMQGGDCAGCKFHFRLDNLAVDHIHPRAKGGQNIKSNLQLLCGSCNSIKGDREMPYLIAQLKSRGILR